MHSRSPCLKHGSVDKVDFHSRKRWSREIWPWLVPHFGELGLRSLVLSFPGTCVCFQLRACLTPPPPSSKQLEIWKKTILDDSLTIRSKVMEGTQNILNDSLVEVTCIWDCCFWNYCWLAKVERKLALTCAWPWGVWFHVIGLSSLGYKCMSSTPNVFDPPSKELGCWKKTIIDQGFYGRWRKATR